MPFVRCTECGVGLPVTDEELQEIQSSGDDPYCEICADDALEFECPECNWIGLTDKGHCRFCHADICSEIFD